MLRQYRQSGFLAGYKLIDWAVLIFTGGYVAREAIDVIARIIHRKALTPAELVDLPVDPLLWILLAEALLLFRSVRNMGSGWIGKCYGAFCAAIFLILVGDMALWAPSWGYLPWPWSALGWYVWMPAAAAFALAPTYQWEAMRSAEFAGTASPA